MFQPVRSIWNTLRRKSYMKYITFAVPCYNSENYMRRCVDSLLIGGKDVEIILIDDGSSDRTAQIADEYEIEYPDIVRVVHKENGGHGSGVNKGLELALNGKIFTGKFKWDLGGNISFVKNKLLSLIEGNDMYIVPSSGSNLLGGSMHALINGQPISTFYMLKMEGIYQRDDEVPAKLYAKGVRAGDVKYFDYNEDGDISDADRMNVGKAIPDFYGGITSNFSYKGFDLSLFGQFSVGGKVMSAWRGVNGSEGTDHLGLALSNVKVNDRGESVEQYFNVSKEVANGYWRGEGTSNTIPRPVRIGVHTGYDYDYNVQTSTRYLEDASYFKLKTVTLGYTLPESVVKKLRVNSLRVYVSADNLLTLTKYSGYDPETSFSGSPGNSNYGVDFGLQPVLRTFIFGLNLNF